MATTTPHANGTPSSTVEDKLLQLNLDLKNLQRHNVYSKHHGDSLLADKKIVSTGTLDDLKHIFTLKNLPIVMDVLGKYIKTHQLDMKAAAPLVGSLPNESAKRRELVDKQVKIKYDRMLHPPLTYLGDAFQYRTVDGKFNNASNPHLGQAGAPYAKTVPTKTHPLGAMPDPSDLFEKLMARQKSRPSKSGLSSMLIYHATIIIHDVFRTNDHDKNISDSSSYLDLSPLYGYTEDMQKKVRDGRYKLGLLKPDVFAEDRLLRQPPGVCILLVMYNRYHNYAATQLRRINENGRFTVPRKYSGTKLEAVVRNFYPSEKQDKTFDDACTDYGKAWKTYQKAEPPTNSDTVKSWKQIREIREKVMRHAMTKEQGALEEKAIEAAMQQNVDAFKQSKEAKSLADCAERLEKYMPGNCQNQAERDEFEIAYDAAWTKMDDDLFNTARLITCGMYIQVSIHDYLRALMGFHQFNTDFTLEPRLEIDHKNVSRGLGNQVTVEFNLLYRFHCAISAEDEKYTEDFMRQNLNIEDPKEMKLERFVEIMKNVPKVERQLGKVEPCYQEFGLQHSDENHFQRNPITGLFDDKKMIKALLKSMDDPISNFGPRNTPRCLKPVEIMGIIQARKWGVGTLNDFRDFFGMERHATFESITANVEIQDALRDLYEHPDKVELYPGVFCESDADMGVDPGPSDVSSALWAAIFSDAITLVRSDRFYTVDWNTHSLTSWGMQEVSADSDILKSSVFHRLIQRAFPGWFPYNSIRFFHPFYTGETNAKYAKEQGYAADFKTAQGSSVDKKSGIPVFDKDASKPKKPVYLTDYDQILAILKDDSYDFVHPALLDPSNFPAPVSDMIRAITKEGSRPPSKGASDVDGPVKDDPAKMETYFTSLMQHIVKRESLAMSDSTYQIDATRDFAIPVVARYIADFLGFGRLVDTEKNLKAQYSENEVYRHVVNCQTFMVYNADETKLLKRRAEFRKSFQFLYEQTLDGNAAEAGKWRMFQRKAGNAMAELGFKVAERVLRHEKTAERTAAVLVFVALNSAHNSVLSFTSVLSLFMKEIYEKVNLKYPPAEKPTWYKVQELAFKEDEASMKELTALVLEADSKSVQLPVIRIAQRTREFKTGNTAWTVNKNDTIILDISRAKISSSKNGKPRSETDYLAYHSSVTDAVSGYHLKHLVVMGLTSMVRFFAQMKNLRRGHGAQGIVKRVRIEQSDEGYANYMAPMRVERIEKEAQEAGGSSGSAVFTKKVLWPESGTFLTAEWDEMLPFPTTWKLRYDGFGKSTYKTKSKDGKEIIDLLQLPVVFDDAPPFYQPKGPSSTGGTFAEVACVCNRPGVACRCKEQGLKSAKPVVGAKHSFPAQLENTYTTGCGISN